MIAKREHKKKLMCKLKTCPKSVWGKFLKIKLLIDKKKNRLAQMKKDIFLGKTQHQSMFFP